MLSLSFPHCDTEHPGKAGRRSHDSLPMKSERRHLCYGLPPVRQEETEWEQKKLIISLDSTWGNQHVQAEK